MRAGWVILSVRFSDSVCYYSGPAVRRVEPAGQCAVAQSVACSRVRTHTRMTSSRQRPLSPTAGEAAAADEERHPLCAAGRQQQGGPCLSLQPQSLGFTLCIASSNASVDDGMHSKHAPCSSRCDLGRLLGRLLHPSWHAVSIHAAAACCVCLPVQGPLQPAAIAFHENSGVTLVWCANFPVTAGQGVGSLPTPCMLQGSACCCHM